MRKELRINLIKAKIKDLENSLSYAEEFLPENPSALKDRGTRNQLYKEIEFSIQLCIDICSIINSDISKETPNDEDDIINLVEKNKVISPSLSKRLREMKGFRNLLVHRYGEVNDEIAHESISSGLKDFSLFISEIESFLKKRR